jgi:hypothetical protein
MPRIPVALHQATIRSCIPAVVAPLPDIPVEVKETKTVGLFLRDGMRRTCGIVFAKPTRLRQRRFAVAAVIIRLGAGAAGILPLRLRWQTGEPVPMRRRGQFTGLHARQPTAKTHRLPPIHVFRRMLGVVFEIIFMLDALRFRPERKLRLRDRRFRQPKWLDNFHQVSGLFVWIVAPAAHPKHARRNQPESHLHAPLRPRENVAQGIRLVGEAHGAGGPAMPHG